MKRLLFALAAACLLGGAAPLAAQSGDYVLVVHASNPATALSKAEASNLFLKKVVKWPDGKPAAPVDLTKGQAVRDAFSKAVHGRSASAIASYWQQQIFAGKDVPPPEKDTDADVLAFVRATPGAVGYVSAGATLGAGVKAIALK